MDAPDATDEFNSRFVAVLEEAFGAGPLPGADEDFIEAGVLDSLEFLTLFMAMEDEFGAMWPTEEMTRYRDLATIARLRAAALKWLWK